jgi:hypothetical protein
MNFWGLERLNELFKVTKHIGGSKKEETMMSRPGLLLR